MGEACEGLSWAGLGQVAQHAQPFAKGHRCYGTLEQSISGIIRENAVFGEIIDKSNGWRRRWALGQSARSSSGLSSGRRRVTRIGNSGGFEGRLLKVFKTPFNPANTGVFGIGALGVPGKAVAEKFAKVADFGARTASCKHRVDI